MDARLFLVRWIGGGLCDKLITRSGESYRMCVCVMWPRNLNIRRPSPDLGCSVTSEHIVKFPTVGVSPPSADFFSLVSEISRQHLFLDSLSLCSSFMARNKLMFIQKTSRITFLYTFRILLVRNSLFLVSLHILTHFTQQSRSREDDRFSATQEIPRILWQLKLHYRIHNSQMDPVHALPPHSSNIHLILFSHLRLGLSSGLFPSGFPTKTLYAPLLTLLHMHISF